MDDTGGGVSQPISTVHARKSLQNLSNDLQDLNKYTDNNNQSNGLVDRGYPENLFNSKLKFQNTKEPLTQSLLKIPNISLHTSLDYKVKNKKTFLSYLRSPRNSENTNVFLITLKVIFSKPKNIQNLLS